MSFHPQPQLPQLSLLPRAHYITTFFTKNERFFCYYSCPKYSIIITMILTIFGF